MREIPIFHAVTDAASVARPGFLDIAARNMRAMGSRGAIHLRAALLPARLVHDLAVELVVIQQETGCWLVVNDRIDIALAVGARAVQLTSRSLAVADAKRIARGIPVGASVHSIADAEAAERAGADWCIAGNVFPTPSHPERQGGHATFIRAITAAVSIPVIAIGGVTPDDVRVLLDSGAYGVATIRGAGWDASTTEQAERTETVLNAHSVGSPAGALAGYISEYDAYRRGEGRNDPHDQRRNPEGSA